MRCINIPAHQESGISTKLTEKTFAELVTLVKDHHQPAPSAIVQRKNFHICIRKQGEPLSNFTADLRKLSEHCKFGDSFKDMLHDHLVCGCNDKRLQCKLLAEKDLTFDTALELAKAYETTEREAKDLQPESSQLTQIHSVKVRRTSLKQFPGQ